LSRYFKISFSLGQSLEDRLRRRKPTRRGYKKKQRKTCIKKCWSYK